MMDTKYLPRAAKPPPPLRAHAALLMAFLLLTLTFLLLTLRTRATNTISLIPSNSTSWHRNVRATSSHIIRPLAVLEGASMGRVRNHQGLITGDEPTVLERPTRMDEVPSVVVDFGMNTVGVLTIEFAGAEGAEGSLPGVRLAFSETLENLGNNSDFTRSYNVSQSSIRPQGVLTRKVRREFTRLTYTAGTARVGGAAHRRDGPGICPPPYFFSRSHAHLHEIKIAVETKPYNYTNELGCRHDNNRVCSDGLHGFRYLRISLDALDADEPFTTPQGRVSISSISLRLSAFLGTPDTFKGWFESSDADMTQWWFDGVYTNDLCTDVFRANDTEPRDAVAEGLLGKLVLHDAPKRDRDPYVGDLAVAGLTAFLSHDTTEGVANVLADLADHQRDDGWIPPASM